jgi:type I restriction enzyme S subunit
MREKENEFSLKDNSGKTLLFKLKQEKERLIKNRLIPKQTGRITNVSDVEPFSLPHNWIWTRLDEISIIQEGPGIRKFQYQDEGIQFLTVTNILEDAVDLEKSKKYISLQEYNDKYKHFTINKNDIVIACSGGSWGKSAIFNHDEKLILNTSTLRLRFFGDLGDNKFLYYLTKTDFFKNQIAEQMSGQQPNFGYSHYSTVKVPLPPLAEQQRIVAILDEAFAAIGGAKENAEKNLLNARELFDSYLQSVFANPGDGWEVKTLGEIATFRNGINFTKGSKGETIKIVGVKDFQKSFWIPFENLESVTVDGKLSEIDVLQDDDILAVRSNGNPELIGRTILAGKVSEKTSHSGFTIRIRLNSKDIFSQYLCHYMKSQTARKQLVESGTGINIKSLNQGALSSLVIPIPTFSEQKTIVSKLESLLDESQKLENIYRQKINDLDELKKSILQKAFNGELTASNKISNVIELPIRISDISTTDLQAGIVATAFQKHQERGKVLTFGHVKAEKIVHLAQSILNIELDREPVKDAAGPNDFRRLKSVEFRAEKARYFKTIKQSYGGFTYTPESQFDSIIEKTKTALDDKFTELTNLIDLLVPMDTQQTELVATVYAAWNNLLIDDLTITVEAIVFEARENWHEAKLNIPRERFFDTISWMKEKNLIPNGKGKKVLAKK